MLEALNLTPSEASRHGIELNKDGRRRSAFELLAYPGVNIGQLKVTWPDLGSIPPRIAAQLEIDARYAAYVARQDVDVITLRRDEATIIPADFHYFDLPGLSTELRGKLERHRPATIAQAAKIDGMTPAALLILLAHVRKPRLARSA